MAKSNIENNAVSTAKSTPKSKTEGLFEAYLSQEAIPFEYEPYGAEEKNPDYRFKKKGKIALAEIKEIEETPFQREANARLAVSNTAAFSFDPKELYDLLRRRIDDACKQLKAHQNEVDACIVILGQKDTGINDVTPDSIFYAMYGDIYLSIPIDPERGGAVGEATSELKVNGALRKNRMPAREMYSPHPYLSAVGVVEEFNGRSMYEQKFYNQLLKKYKPPTAQDCLRYLSEEWEKHQDKIPAMYRDPKKMYYRVRLIANPLSQKPLPRGLFNGRWDQVRYPRVVSQ